MAGGWWVSGFLKQKKYDLKSWKKIMIRNVEFIRVIQKLWFVMLNSFVSFIPTFR